MLLAAANVSVSMQLAFSALLLVISAGLIWHHIRVWNTAKIDPENLRAIEFARQQYRRRMNASGLVGVVGITVLAGIWIHDPFVAACYWLGVLLLVLWILLLAMFDALHSFSFLRRQRRRHLVEQAELQAQLLREIRRLREQDEE